MEISNTTIAESKADFNDLSKRLTDAAMSSPNIAASSDEPLSITLAAMRQFFDIAEGVDARQEIFAVNDISDIGEKGLIILEKLVATAELLQLPTEKESLGQIVLVVADWIIQRDGSINLLEPIVDAVAQVANTVKDQQQLIALAAFIGEIADACSDKIKHDLELTNRQRPWRLLNINRGIVATRTLDPTTMRNVFSSLIQALPMDAPDFFKEGMSEMVRLNYPDNIRELMQEYFEKTDVPQIH